MRILITRPRQADPPGIIDMNPDGSFAEPRHATLGRAPLSTRIFRAAILVATLAAALAIAGLAIWFALMLIPVALAAGAVAWAAWRWQVWRNARHY